MFARLVSVAAVLVSASACKTSRQAEEAAVIVRADSKGLLLTWFDDFGDFHVAQSVAEVPINRREHVRVIDPSKADGTKDDRIFVADLRQVQPDGRFPIRVLTRAEFEKLARSNGQQSGPTVPATAAPNPEGPSASGPAIPANPQTAVIIYGAEWCQPCHQAASYLTRKGVKIQEKDIESDPSAASEMREKLKKAGLRGGSIPVIDVRGRMLVGFDRGEVDRALGESL
jgi:glutaredoxin